MNDTLTARWVTPQPTQNLRTNPVAIEAIDKIKATIVEDGYFGVGEFKLLMEETNLNSDEFLVHLQEEGITFIKTRAANEEVEQEVLVDMRYMAAAMLLIYSERTFARSNSVLKYLRMLFMISEWRAAFPMVALGNLLPDMYGDLGHNFTVSEVAENANLNNEDETLILKKAERYAHPMRELVKSDAELTAVYLLAMRTMDVVNGTNINGRRAVRSDIQFRHFNKPKAYGLFWTAAQKILDQHCKRKS